MNEPVNRRAVLRGIVLTAGSGLLGIMTSESVAASGRHVSPAQGRPAPASDQTENPRRVPLPPGTPRPRGVNVNPHQDRLRAGTADVLELATGDSGSDAVVSSSINLVRHTNSPSPAILKAYGINAVRLISYDSEPVEEYARRCQEEGIFVLAVVVNQSEGHVLQHADAIQIGNEPDGQGPASWKMSTDAYVDLWNGYRKKHEGRTLITAGLTRSDPAWDWSAVVPRLEGQVDGIARHSYGDPNGPPRTPRRLQQILVDLRKEGRKRISEGCHWIDTVPIWITEWHPLDSVIHYIPWLAEAMEEHTAGDFFYCWSDDQTPGRGLFREDGRTPKPELDHFMRRPPAPISDEDIADVDYEHGCPTG
jgi:hypothetical protein